MAIYDWFSRVLIPLRQRPSSTDLNRMQEFLESNDRRLAVLTMGSALNADPTQSYAGQSAAAFPPVGFHGGGFKPFAAGSFNIGILAGVGYNVLGPASATDIDGVSGADWTQDSLMGAPIALSTSTGFVTPAPPSGGNSRIDIIEVRPNYVAANPETVGIFNTVTGVFDALAKNKKMKWDVYGLTGTVNSPADSTAPLSYKVGAVAAGGISAATEPATTSGYVKIARINVVGGVGSIVATDIADMRPIIRPSGQLRIAGRVRVPGTSSGVGDPALGLYAIEAPPGVTVKVQYDSTSSPSTGSSYNINFYVFSGDIRPRTAATLSRRGVAMFSSEFIRVFNTTAPQYGQLTAGTVAILAANTATNHVLNGVETYAVGQPFITFQAQIRSTDTTALLDVENLNFTFDLSQA